MHNKYRTCASCLGTGKTHETFWKCAGDGYEYIDCSYCVSGYNTCKTCKGVGDQQLSPPAAPELEDCDCYTVVLQTLNNGEYSLDRIVWQSSPTFEGLEAGKEYCFYQRYARTNTSLASIVSDGLKVTVQEHIFDNTCDAFCNACGTMRTGANHAYGSYTEIATGHQKICSVCGDIVAENHTWDSGEVTLQPTCGEVGVLTYTCVTCETTRTEDIPATNYHIY